MRGRRIGDAPTSRQLYWRPFGMLGRVRLVNLRFPFKCGVVAQRSCSRGRAAPEAVKKISEAVA
jgi:hypothetical protein